MFNLPLIVVITHLDEMNKDEEIEAVFNIKQFLKKLYPEKTPCVIKEMEYAVLFSVIFLLFPENNLNRRCHTDLSCIQRHWQEHRPFNKFPQLTDLCKRNQEQ